MKWGRSRARTIAAIVACAALGLVAACGSGGSSSNDSSGSTLGGASSAAGRGSPNAPSGTPIAIGSIGSFGGAEGSTLISGEYAVKAWAAWTNDHGGLNGHPVKLTVMDDGGNAATALTQVKTLVEKDHVVAIVGDQSNEDTTWASYVESKGVPVIGGLSLETPFLTNPDFFPQGTNVLALNYGALALAKKQGPKYAFFYCAEAPVCAQASSLFKALGTAAGVSVVVTQGVSATATSYSAQCNAVKSSGADSYQLGVSVAVVTRVSQECKRNGVSARLIGTDGNITQETLSSPGEQGMIAAEMDFPFADSSTEATRTFQAAMKQYAPGLGSQLGPNAVYSWVSGQLLAAAVKASNSTDITSASIKQGLYALPKGETLGGIAPPLSFTPGKPARINCYFVEGVDHNQLTEPQGLTTSCAPDAVVEGIASHL
jgi:branched-chain amino acid transport system substrate-binding protein